MRQLNLAIETFPIAGSFRIAHGSITEISVVTVTLTQDGHVGRGECRPYARYGETSHSVCKQIQAVKAHIHAGLSRSELQTLMPAGAARNAVDCALWDLQAKQSGIAIWERLGLAQPTARSTAYTLSIDTPINMAKAALAASAYRLLKIKINDISGLQSALSIMQVRPDCELIIDANEALSAQELTQFREALHGKPVLMIEQPLPASLLANHPQDPDILPILCADESLHGRKDLDEIWAAGYRAVNVKLDKCGGLTEGLALIQAAKQKGFVIMAGCMVGTSLAMAPMLYIAGLADVIDLDGPILLAKDRPNAIVYKDDVVGVPSRRLWG